MFIKSLASQKFSLVVCYVLNSYKLKTICICLSIHSKYSKLKNDLEFQFSHLYCSLILNKFIHIKRSSEFLLKNKNILKRLTFSSEKDKDKEIRFIQ